MNLSAIRRKVEQLTPPPPPPLRLIMFAVAGYPDDEVIGMSAYGHKVERLPDETLAALEERLVAILPTDNPWVVGEFIYRQPSHNDTPVSMNLHKRK